MYTLTLTSPTTAGEQRQKKLLETQAEHTVSAEARTKAARAEDAAEDECYRPVAANRRLLHIQQLDHDPVVGQAEFDELTQPSTVGGQRASGLKFGDPVVPAVLSALLLFRSAGALYCDTSAHLG